MESAPKTPSLTGPISEFPPSPVLTHTRNTSGNFGMFVNPQTCSCAECVGYCESTDEDSEYEYPEEEEEEEEQQAQEDESTDEDPDYDYPTSEEEDDDFIECCVCGKDCSGGSYESMRICSRKCLVYEA